jgi:hypothetical protein
MKKVLFILMAVLVTVQVSAGVLLVKEYGVNGTYSTIQSAINATVEGDTVLVFPKPSGIAWSEGTLYLDNQIILLDSDGSPFSQNGTSALHIQIADGRQYDFMGWDWSGRNIYFNSGSASENNKCIVNITDCVFSTVDLNREGIDARIFNNTIHQLNLRYGVIIANDLHNLDIINEYSWRTDTLLIIANINVDIDINTNYYVWMYNNYVREHDGDYALSITNMNSGSDNYNIIANNTFYYDQSEGVRVEWHSNTKITNNYFYNSYQNHTWALQGWGSTSGTPFVSYNYANYNGSSSRNQCNIPMGLEYNCFGSCQSGNYSLGSRGKVIQTNSGNYLGEYNDIDLTRNDVGTYGGPHSIDNFWDQPNPNNSKARINFLNLPHFFTTPGTIDLKGGAHIRE